ncbi:unnamed protein product [Microthlaspi erraticum]|uniref:KIB1-4 beta-propeller domain-containing protein n=1 Tax=Microthlaspi erraticum TaxID=1685480 RepID=A0A6D2HJX1_9BRAS|nr:unnamed protein product [Microthlaspi erraticum]CAA7033034.1 unnamed protein product [Microthlaspi erraticum]
MAQRATKEETLSMPDWTLLPEDLLHVVSTHLENFFDIVQARSVCSSWRSTFAFPACLLRPSYCLPSFAEFPCVSKDLCIQKIPLFLFMVQTSPAASELLCEFFLGEIGRDKSEDGVELPSPPIQCSVKVKIDPTLMNMLDRHIFPLGHQYKMIGWDPGNWRQDYRGMTFLPLNKERRRGEFIVLLNYAKRLFVLTSAEMRWMRLKRFSVASCKDLVTFRGRFYATFMNGDIFVIDPYSLEATTLLPPSELLASVSCEYLVPSGNDELFLVEKFLYYTGVSILSPFALRVSRLDEEAGKWVVVTELGDRVLFINGDLGNVCCSAKDLPYGCGVSGDSILFTNELSGVITCFYKYGGDDNFKFWRYSRENHVKTLSTFPVEGSPG